MQYMRFQSPKVRKKFAGASIVFAIMYKKKNEDHSIGYFIDEMEFHL